MKNGQPVVDKILDTAGQKGTGKWTGIAALDEGVPLTLIGEAVFARCLSSMKEEALRRRKNLQALRQSLTATEIALSVI